MSGAVSSGDVLRQIRRWLESETLGEDGRLPPERDLAQRFGVSRGAVRKAMAHLEAEGRIWRHVGRGTFARRVDPPVATVPGIAEYTSPPEAMEARLLIEPGLARLAALRANAAQIARLRQLATGMRAVTSWGEYEEADFTFHQLIAEAAGNRLLDEVQRLVNGVRRTVVWGHLRLREAGPSPDYHSFAEHEAIVEAIAVRDRRAAEEAMRLHLMSTAKALTFEG